jgi:arylsulfatase A-like enzyme
MPRAARRLAVVALAGLASMFPAIGPDSPASGQTGDPNIVVIVTDDHRATETLEWMPKTMQWFGQGGTNFTNAYATTPLCCPARAAIMTGRFNHNNAVLDNGDQANLDHASTIQRYLGQHGYLTGIAGKFLNGWQVSNDPPNFDRWAIMKPDTGIPGQRGYYGTDFNVDGTVGPINRYSTDFIADRAEEMLDDWNDPTDDAKPFYLYVTPYAPHGPWTAEGGHGNDDDDYRFTDVGTWAGNPAVFETDEADKPTYVRNADASFEEGASNREGQLRALLSVDDLVDDLFQKLSATGEIDNTLALFISDNGFFWSEHGLNGKNQPYTESIRVPLMMRWPGRVATGAIDGRFAANIDIVPTIMEAAGVSPESQYPLDGRSLLGTKARKKMLTESWPQGSRGPWASIRAPKYQYIEYYDDTSGAVDFREFYDLTRDPFQLTNLFRDKNVKNDPFVQPLADELAAIRSCVGSECNKLLNEKPVPIRCPKASGAAGHHMVGSDDRDAITGIPSRDVACGLQARDNLRGKGGKDRLIGGPGGDVLDGGPGPDKLQGGPGRDVCRGGPGKKDRLIDCEVRRP